MTRPYEVVVLAFGRWYRVDPARFVHLSSAKALADDWAKDPDVTRAQVRDQNRRPVYDTDDL